MDLPNNSGLIIPTWYREYLRPTPGHIRFGSEEFKRHWHERFEKLTPEQQEIVNEINKDSRPVEVPFEL